MSSKTRLSAKEFVAAIADRNTAHGKYFADTNQLVIREVVVEEEVQLDGIEIPHALILWHCRFRERIRVTGGTYASITISGGRLDAPLLVSGGSIGLLRLDDIDARPDRKSDRKYSLELSGGDIDRVVVTNGRHRSIELGNASIASVKLDGAHPVREASEIEPYISELSVSSRRLDVLEVSDFTIESLSIGAATKEGCIYAFSDLRIRSLTLLYFVNNGRLRLHEIQPIAGHDPSHAPDGRLRALFDGPRRWIGRLAKREVDLECAGVAETPESLFTIARSDLGKTHFSSCDLRFFDRVELRDATMTEIMSSDVRWFDPSQLSAPPPLERDIYRQLKHAMIAQGNRAEELQLNALEMGAYERSLSWSRDPWDRSILYLERITNRFGTSYARALVSLILGAAFFFALSAYSSGASIADSWGKLVYVLNPTHPVDYLGKGPSTANGFLVIDFAGRVVVAFLIYQLITPFRKFAKR